jgi:hypothetical protein
MAFAFPSVSFCPPGSGGSFLLLWRYKNGAKPGNSYILLILLYFIILPLQPPEISIIAVCNSFKPMNFFMWYFRYLSIIASLAANDCKMQRKTYNLGEAGFFLKKSKN